MIHKHHSIPRSRGGADAEWNFVEVDPYAHAYGHALDFVLFEQAPVFDCRHDAWPLLPEKLREAVRKELSNRMSNRVVAEETRLKISSTMSGRSPSNKGKTMPEEFGQKISNSKRGKPAHNRGVSMSSEQREAISKKLQGRILSEEHKAKISSSMKAKNPQRRLEHD